MCCMEDFSIYGCAQCSLADCRLWTRLGHTRVKTSARALPYDILPAIKSTIDGDRQRGRRAHKSMTTDRLRSRESAGPPTSCPCRRDATTATSCYSWPSSSLRPFPPRRRPAAPGWHSRPLFNTSQTAASAAAPVAAAEVTGARWIFSLFGGGGGSRLHRERRQMQDWRTTDPTHGWKNDRSGGEKPSWPAYTRQPNAQACKDND